MVQNNCRQYPRLIVGGICGRVRWSSVNSVSYTYEIDNESHDAKILVFDNEPEGNGACNLARKYFHLPISIRDIANSFGDTYLPTHP